MMLSARVVSAAIISLAVILTNSVCETRKLDGKIDLVLIVPRYYRNYSDKFRNAIKMLPENHVEMGDQKVKIAIVEGMARANETVLRLTGSQRDLESALKSDVTPYVGPYYYENAFKTAREVIFNFDDKERAKVVVLLAPVTNGNQMRPVEEAKLLRDKGVFIYVMYSTVISDIAEDAKNYTGGSTERTLGLPHYDLYNNWIDKMPNVIDAIFRDLCGWDAVCRYPSPDRDRCESKVFRPKIAIGHNPDPQNECDAHDQKPSDRKCDDPDACKDECDKRWEWSGPTDCKASCVVVKRKTETPPEEMENCPPEACSCQTSQQSTKSTKGTTPEPITGPAKVTTHQSTMPAKEPPTQKPSEESETSSWLIPVIVAVIVVVLITVAVIAFVVVRKKKRNAAKAADDARLKKMAMSKSMGAVSKSKGVKSVFAGRGFAARATTTGSKGATTGVVADLTTVEKSMASKTTRGKSMVRQQRMSVMSKRPK